MIDLKARKYDYYGKKYTWIATKRPQVDGIWMERVECDTVPRTEAYSKNDNALDALSKAPIDSNSKLFSKTKGPVDLGVGKCDYDGKKYTWITTKRQGDGIWMERVECDTVPRAELSKEPIEIPTPLADLETSKTYDIPKKYA